MDGSATGGATGAASGSEAGGDDGAGFADPEFGEDPAEGGVGAVFETQPRPARVFAAMLEAKCCAEGAAGGDFDIYRGAILHSDDYAAGNTDAAGRAQR